MEGKPSGSVLQQQQVADTLKLFDKTDPSNSLNLGGTRYIEMPNPYSNKSGTTKSFDTSALSNQSLQSEVFAYAENLAGGGKLAPTRDPGVWSIQMENGTTINVRSVSSSSFPDGSQARWTVDIQGNAQLNAVMKNKPVEVKFK